MSRSAASRANKRGEPPPSPEPLPGPALDSHTHLDIVLGERPAGDDHGEWASDEDVDAEIAAAAAVGVPLAAPTPVFKKLDESIVEEELRRLEEDGDGE